MKPLDRVAKMSVLTKAGVEKVFKFGNLAINMNQTYSVFSILQSASQHHPFQLAKPELTLCPVT